MTGIFINYRGDDSQTAAALIDRELTARFGSDQVFLDSRSIPAGADFGDELLGRVRTCSVLVVVIGPRWLSLTGEAGQRRIDDPRDWLRREIVEAFTHGLRVIPVLMDGVTLPAEDQLPDDIVGLSRRQYVPLRRRHTTIDLGDLAERITQTDPELAKIAAQRQANEKQLPRQLPAAVGYFAGRVGELAALTGLLRERTDTGGTVVISAIGGTAGVGKTALAVHWAHQVADRFPDGQLYVNLRGFDPSGQVMAPTEAVRRFLDALHVPPDRIPVDLDAQAALYRSQLAGKRMLVVLDNARDAEQVRPLLPGTGTALVLVTSRNQLTSLVAADGAHPLTLDLLTHHEAHELLERRLGPDRVAAEPQATEQIISASARLPLALAIAAARAAQTRFPLTVLAGELADTHDRLGVLDAGDPATRVRTVFSWSYTTLTPPAARLFRLLGLHPGPDASAAAAASLAGLPPAETGRLLAELTRAGLTTQHTPGRYSLHDLLAAYAAEQCHTTDPDDERRAATGRLLDHYTHTAHTAARLLTPARDPIVLPLTPPAPGTTPEQPAGHREALAWLDVERPVLLAALRLAAQTGSDTHTWQLAWALDTFLDRRGRWQDQAGAWQAAVAAADHLTHPTAAGAAHRLLAWASIRLGRHGEANTHLCRALDLHTRAGDRAGQAKTHIDLAYLWERQDRLDQALDHAQQALTLYQATGYHRGQAQALNNAGWCHALLGDHTQALTYCQRALTLFQQIGERAGEATTWDSLGYAHHHLHQHTQAANCYQHALTLFRDLGDRYQEAATLTHLGDTHHATGNPQAAREAWQQALTILDELEHSDAEQVRGKLAALEASTIDSGERAAPA
jgi:tetratricopeptide (TPR) repeat protein